MSRPARLSLHLQSSRFPASLTLQFEVRRGGEQIQSPVPRVSPLTITVRLGACVSNMWHKAAGCTPELVAFPCNKETSVTHGMFFPYIQR